MSVMADSAERDLAYLRALVETPGRLPRAAGLTFALCGAIYAVPAFAYWLQLSGWVGFSPLAHLVFGIGPTILFTVVLTFILVRQKGGQASGIAGRAMTGTFMAIGITNLVLIAVFAPLALRNDSLTLWLLFPAVACALQGTGWLLAYLLRRLAWIGIVAAGWFATAIALGATVGTPSYLLVLAIGLCLFMVLPGLKLMRESQAAG